MKTITEQVVEEAVKLHFENNNLSVTECIERAEQMYAENKGYINNYKDKDICES